MKYFIIFRTWDRNVLLRLVLDTELCLAPQLLLSDLFATINVFSELKLAAKKVSKPQPVYPPK